MRARARLVPSARNAPINAFGRSRHAGASLNEAVGEASPGRNFDKQVGKADTRQQAIEACFQLLRLIRARPPPRRDGQAAILDFGLGIHRY